MKRPRATNPLRGSETDHYASRITRHGSRAVTETREQEEDLPSISAIVPAYNNADTIERALNSIYAQTYPKIAEVILVDDGSDDGTGEIVQSKFPEVRYVWQENQGSGAARNHALRLAQGEYIAFLDADDEWLPSKVQQQVEVLRAHPGAVAAATRYLRVREGHDWRPAAARASDEGIEIQHFHQAIRTWKFGPMPSLLISREVVSKVGGFDETLRRAQDAEFILRIMAAGYAILRLRQVLTIVWFGASSGFSWSWVHVSAARAALDIVRRCAPDAPPPLGGILSRAEYSQILFKRALISGRCLLRNGEAKAAYEAFAEAAQCAPSWRHRLSGQLLTLVSRGLWRTLGERSGLLKSLGDLLRGKTL
jgi:glycosyltransferase involved in cell wall biosynthesis